MKKGTVISATHDFAGPIGNKLDGPPDLFGLMDESTAQTITELTFVCLTFILAAFLLARSTTPTTPVSIVNASLL
jgi:hypothetical protein